MIWDGARPSPPDDRDYRAEQGYVAMGVRPTTYKPPRYIPVVNQGDVNSCVGESIATFASYALDREVGLLKEFNSMFLYHNRLPTHHQGTGMYAREALAQFVKDGVPTMTDFKMGRAEYPNVSIRALVDIVRDQAKPNKAVNYFTIARYEEVCDAIYQNGAVIVVIAVRPSFAAFFDKSSPVVPMPSNTESTIGCHAMTAIGYDGDGLLIQNSAGDYFGKGGFCVLPPEYPILECWGVVDEIHFWDVVSVQIGSLELNKNGEITLMDVAPCIRNGRTMVPLRAISEAFGAAVNWSPSGDITIAYRGKIVHLQVGSPNMYSNGVRKVLDVPAMLENDRTFVPLRAITEAFGFDVEWIESTQQVIMRCRR